MMWLFSGVPQHPEKDTLMEKHSTEALYSTVKGVVNAIQTEDEEFQQNAAQQMIQIAKDSIIRRWSESNLTNLYITIWILEKNSHLVGLA